MAILGGAALLLWPAFLNGYPLVFSDTGAILEMSLEPTMGWDKPWVYAPFLHAFHWRTTLWPPVLAQGVIVSHLLWLTQAVLAPPAALRHFALCAILTAGSAAPWFASTLMPDAFTPVVVLCVFVLAWGPGRVGAAHLAWAGALGTVAVAFHLSHLVMAAGCVATVAVLRRAIPWRPALPLAAALGVLLLTNLVGNGVLSVSPNGSVFALARLIGDGPGRDYIDAACPGAALQLCAWRGRLPQDSDAFLWNPDGPMWDATLWGDRFGPIAVAPEASRLVPAIIAAYPGRVLAAAAANTVRQLGMVRVGDTLGPDYLDDAVLPKLVRYFPAAEAGRFGAGRQARGLLRTAAAPLWPLHLALLMAGGLGTVALAMARSRELAGLAAVVLVALLGNAFATGALSKPHDRYQARVAWLVLLPPLFYAARRDTSSGLICTRAS